MSFRTGCLVNLCYPCWPLESPHHIEYLKWCLHIPKCFSDLCCRNVHYTPWVTSDHTGTWFQKLYFKKCKILQSSTCKNSLFSYTPNPNSGYLVPGHTCKGRVYVGTGVYQWYSSVAGVFKDESQVSMIYYIMVVAAADDILLLLIIAAFQLSPLFALSAMVHFLSLITQDQWVGPKENPPKPKNHENINPNLPIWGST